MYGTNMNINMIFKLPQKYFGLKIKLGAKLGS